MHRRAAECLAGAQHGAGKIRTVRRIGVVLCFEAEAVVFFAGLAAFSDHGAVEEISRVELDARLGRRDPHHAAAARLVRLRCERERAGIRIFRVIDHVAMIVAAGRAGHLREVPRERLRPLEIHRAACDRGDPAGRDARGVHGDVAARVHRDLMAEHVAFASAREVPVGVVREVQHRRLVGRGLVVEAQLVVVRERVGHCDGELAGVSLLAVGAHVGKAHAISVRERLRLPNARVESRRAAVEMVHAVVRRELILLSVECEFPECDAVREAPGRHAEMWMRHEVAVERVEAERDVRQRAAAIRRVHLHEARAPVRQLRAEVVVAVREDECVHRLTGGSFSKGFDFHAGWGCSARPVHSEQRRGRESVAEGRVNCKAREAGHRLVRGCWAASSYPPSFRVRM